MYISCLVEEKSDHFISFVCYSIEPVKSYSRGVALAFLFLEH